MVQGLQTFANILQGITLDLQLGIYHTFWLLASQNKISLILSNLLL